MSDRFRWTPLGGLGEVGMNCMVMGFGDQDIAIDAGVLFADDNDYGIDAVYPDFRKWLQEKRLKNWLITHGHEDHIGAVPSIFYLCKQLGFEPPRFYAPPLAHALIEQKLTDSRYPGISGYKSNVQKIEAGEELTFGDVKVKYIEVRHSTPESCALAFWWKDLSILHTADFKLDYHHFEDGVISVEAFDVFGGKSPDVLFMDSTNADRIGQSISEQEIKDHLGRVIDNAPGRLFVTLFSSNLYRIAMLAHLAETRGRRVCLAGRSMRQSFHAAIKLGILKKCPSFSEATLVEPEESVNLDPKKVLVICSGSQGEFRSVLSKIGSRSHPIFRVDDKDTVLFSSKMIPGNEKTILRLVDSLLQQNLTVLWGERAEASVGGPLHASGHGRGDELKETLRFVKPKNLIPVHGALHQLRQTELLAQEVVEETGIPIRTFVGLNNSRVTFEKRGASWEIEDYFVETIPQEKFLRLEYFDSPSRDPFLKARKFAADGGVLSATVDSLGRVSIETRGILPENYIFSENFTMARVLEDLEEWLHYRVHKFEKSGALQSEKLPSLKADLEDELGRYIKKLTGSKPLVFIHFVQL